MLRALAPYRAIFAAALALTLQYRAAAFAGFLTQCSWGAVKVMVLAGFYRWSAAPAPIALSEAITYTWLAQGFIRFLPWSPDAEVALAVRTGAVAYDRLRPLDTFGWWYARALAWLAGTAAPRAALMFAFAAVLLPLVGLGDWSLRPAAGPAALGLFLLSILSALALSAACVVLLNVLMVAQMTDRAANLLALPIVTVLSGGLIPLALFPAWMQPTLAIQPFAGLMDIPNSIWLGRLEGIEALAALGRQLAWTLAFAWLGRVALNRALARLEVQGG